MSYSATGPDSGRLDYGEKTIDFAGLEPVTDNNVVNNRVLDATAD